MIAKFIKLQFDLSIAGFAYSVGYIYLSIIFIISILFPPIKNILKEYEIHGTTKSVLLISIISGFIYFSVFSYFVLNGPARSASAIELFVWLLLFIGGGLLALYLLYDYKKDKKVPS